MVIFLETIIALFLANLVYNSSGISKSLGLAILVVGFLVLPATLKAMLILIGITYFVIQTAVAE